MRLLGLAAALPERVRSSEELEAIVAEHSPLYRLRRGTIECMTGIRTRRVADDHVQCSDLAVDAARAALAMAGLRPRDIDLLIFAAAGQDMIEPATSHIVQSKLGTQAQVFDVKNACNSFLNGVQLAEALLMSGACRRALVTTGEVCSRAINWCARSADEFKRNFPGYTMGDAGAAAVLDRSNSPTGAGIFYRGFASRSEHWQLATIPCGGSVHPRGDEFTYLRGDGPRLKQTFVEQGPCILDDMMREGGVAFDEFERVFVHQVGVPYHHDMLAASGMPADKVDCIVAEYGNMASASIPVAHALAASRGRIGPGDRIMWVGMASGISVGVLMIEL